MVVQLENPLTVLQTLFVLRALLTEISVFLFRACVVTTRQQATLASLALPVSSLLRATRQKVGTSVCGTRCCPLGVRAYTVSTGRYGMRDTLKCFPTQTIHCRIVHGLHVKESLAL